MRSSFPEIKYGSPWKAFEKGDYCYAARNAGDDLALKAASFVMLSKPYDALPLFERIDAPDMLYYKAIAYWQLGDRDRAREILQKYTPKNPPEIRARQLENLISRKIRVLVQMRRYDCWTQNNLFPGLKDNKQFDVISVGHQPGLDIMMDPYETLESVLNRLPKGWVPDFYLCYLMEVELMPVGIEKAPFAVFVFSGDLDAHLELCYPYYRLADAAVVPGSLDHFNWSRATGIKMHTYPIMWTIDLSCGGPRQEKDIDIFMGGNCFSSIFNDKIRLIFRLIQLSQRYNLYVPGKHLSSEVYHEVLLRSKLTLSYVRRYGTWNSRAADALACGCAVLVQEDGDFSLYFSEDEGAVPYREDNLEEVAKRVLSQWDEKYKEAALRGMKKAWRDLNVKTVVDRLFKFLTLASLEIDPMKRETKYVKGSELRCPCLMDPWIVADRGPNFIKKVYSETRKRIEPLLPDPYYYNILAELYAMQFFLNEESKNEEKDCLKRAFEILEEGKSKYPDNLAILFNLGRLYFHSGVFDKAKEVFAELLSKDTLKHDPLDSMYPYDFFPEHFPYIEYLMAVTSYLTTSDEKMLQKAKDLIKASASWLSAVISFEKGDYKETKKICEMSLENGEIIPQQYWLYANTLVEFSNCRENHQKIIEFVKKAIELKPILIHPPHVIASIFEKIDRKDELIKYLRKWKIYFRAIRGNIVLDERDIYVLLKYKRQLNLMEDENFDLHLIEHWLNNNWDMVRRLIKIIERRKVLSPFLLCFLKSYFEVKKSGFKNIPSKQVVEFCILTFKHYEEISFDLSYQIYNWGSRLQSIGDLNNARVLFEFFFLNGKYHQFWGDKKGFVGGVHFHLGCIYKELGNKEKAKSEFEKCMELIPDHKKANENLRALNL